MFDPRREIDLVLSLYPSLCASVTTTLELFHMLLNPLIHDNLLIKGIVMSFLQHFFFYIGAIFPPRAPHP